MSKIENERRKVEAAATGFSAALLVWMRRMARRKLREVPALLRGKFDKGDDDEDMTAELLSLFHRYGVAEYSSAGRGAARKAGVGNWQIPRELYADLTDRMASKVKLLVADTEDMVRESIRSAISDALQQQPEPSAQEVARRIARSWMGPPSKKVPERGSAQELKVTADWRRAQEDIDAGGREHLFSYARAQTIARTEIGQIRTEATAAAYADVGVQKVKWLAYPDDGRSGGREHWRMNKHRAISIEDMQGTDESRWFELPDGWAAPYPQAPNLPAHHVVNCRCMIVPA
jgi:hypothetical protein